MKKAKRVGLGWAAAAVAVLAVVVMAAACGSSSSSSSSSSSPGGSSGGIVGAGSTFAQPLYEAWAQGFKSSSGTQINYQGVGSTAGISAIEAKTVQFGATDAPLTASELQTQGMVQFPTAVGGTAVIVNLSGISSGQVKLDGPTLADIYLGKVTKWNDSAITSLNPGVKLPAAKINVVHRADGSGTSWIFTSYLSAVSPTWKSQVGASTSPDWPTGTGGTKSAGVATLVQQVNGSIGYVEYTYAKQNNITTIDMKNVAGKFVSPTLAAFTAATKNAKWDASAGYATAIVNAPGASSWPITGATFALVQKSQNDAETAKSVLSFFDYGYKNGASTATSLDYVPIPSSVYTQVESDWSNVAVSGTPVWP